MITECESSVRNITHFQRVSAVLYADARESLRCGDWQDARDLQQSAARFAQKARVWLIVKLSD